jgi:hypothetical protein
LITKKILSVVVLCALSLAIAPAQDSGPAATAQDSADNTELLRQATFSIETDYAIFNFVLLTNKTVDALFSGPSKYQIRANANASTVFYVHGVMKKNFNFEPMFEVVQNNQTISAKPVNIKNFKNGPIEKDTKIEGLVSLVRKLNLYAPFTIRDFKKSYELEYTPEAIEHIQN